MEPPPFSRQQLGRHRFQRTDAGDWIVVFRPYYAALFTQLHPAIMTKSHTGWRIGQNGSDRYAYLHDLNETNIADIQAFISAYERLVIIALNDNIRPYFSDELDACMALDFHMVTLDSGGVHRTEIGELEYQAKYHQSSPAVATLATELERAFAWMPASDTYNPAAERCITYIPPEHTKQMHLPRDLARLVAPSLSVNRSVWGYVALVDAALTGLKASLKNATFEQKIAEWDRIISQDEIALSKAVQGYNVYVVDDLYQSGATLWSFAKYLKSVGASKVFGLVCVKSLRDTDNV